MVNEYSGVRDINLQWYRGPRPTASDGRRCEAGAGEEVCEAAGGGDGRCRDGRVVRYDEREAMERRTSLEREASLSEVRDQDPCGAKYITRSELWGDTVYVIHFD